MTASRGMMSGGSVEENGTAVLNQSEGRSSPEVGMSAPGQCIRRLPLSWSSRNSDPKVTISCQHPYIR